MDSHCRLTTEVLTYMRVCVCLRGFAGCCEEEGASCLESGSTTAKKHSIDWGLVKGRFSTTGTCYVKASTDEATPYVTEDP